MTDKREAPAPAQPVQPPGGTDAIWRMLQLQLEHLKRADAKAALLLACYGVLFTLFILLVINVSPDALTGWQYLVGTVDFAALLVGLGAVVTTIVPITGELCEEHSVAGCGQARWCRIARRIATSPSTTQITSGTVLSHFPGEFAEHEARRLCEDDQYARETFAHLAYSLAEMSWARCQRLCFAVHMLYVALAGTVLFALMIWSAQSQ